MKQAASPWNVVYGRSRIGGVIAYLNTYAQQNVALDLVVAHVGHHVARVGNAGRNGLPFGGLYLGGKEVLCDHYGNSARGQLTQQRQHLLFRHGRRTRTGRTVLGLLEYTHRHARLACGISADANCPVLQPAQYV